jgi:hydrogenase maturation protein HypF
MRRRITLSGAVQGVGFRPFVYRRARQLGLAGWVLNSTAGVTIEAEGEAAGIAALIDSVKGSPPPNARIACVSVEEIAPQGEAMFSIRSSRIVEARTAEVLPDLATCLACLAELFDPANRRHRYPFINCTQCGSRYSIVESLPYDRARTSMRHFRMCPACQAEYDDPSDRRFHAEPNACPACGPRLSLWQGTGNLLAHDDDALTAAVSAIRGGKIIAVKGIGGFHLLAAAHDEAAVNRLRAGKRRMEKPFAVMFPDVAAVRRHCHLGTTAQALLSGPERPIVLLERKAGSMAPSVAPDNHRLGALLPYSPLHHLLMSDLGFPVVATSGNVAEEPIVTDEMAAFERLAGIAELFLVHDRPIVRPLDDSVAQVVCGRPQVLRRARGYAPGSLATAGTAASVLAFGSHLKATAALSRASGVVVSQHLGDLESAAARKGFDRALVDLVSLHDARPRLAARDLHPDYASSHTAEASGLPMIAVQHHVAHVAACLGEHGLAPPALGVAWDGAGYGTDGTIWGGEFIRLDESGWRRVASLRPFRIPGGDAASREPRRAALGLLHAAFGDDAFGMEDLPPVVAFTPAERKVLKTVLEHGLNAPLTSSMGRLFDAFASLCGIRQRTNYEGQAAVQLEALVGLGARPGQRYAFPVRDSGGDACPLIVDWQPALEAALTDLRRAAAVVAVGAAFHAGLANAVVDVARRVAEPRVVLTGGCFQNVRLTEATVVALRSAGFTPVWHERIPPNDGGIAFGQAVWTGWRERTGGGVSCA